MEENKKKWEKKDFVKTVINSMDLDNDGEIDFKEFKDWFLDFLDYGSPKNETNFTKSIRKTKDEDGNKQINGYVVLKQLGKGSFGTVFLCMHSNTQKPYAMKVMEKEVLKKIKSGKSNGLELVNEEIKLHAQLKHPNVVKLFDVMDDEKEDKIYLIMEFMSQGVAYKENEKLKEEKAKKYFIDILLGLEYSKK
jgi:serine/threonine protein kinase